MSHTTGRILRRWADVIRTSLPSRKPQLWEDIPFYARRRITYTAESILTPASLDRPRLVRLRSSGIFVEVLPRRYVGQSIFLYGVWEIVGTRLLDVLLRPGMRFIDVGANVGYYTLLAAARVGPQGWVDSFEPHDVLRSMLARGVQANGFTNVHVRPEAVTASSGSVALYPYSQGNEGVSSTIPSSGVEHDPIAVPAISLDDLLLGQPTQAPNSPVLVIKIDVEGAELEVFAGMRQLLASPFAPAAILFESSAAAACADVLRSSGYDVMGTYFSLGRGLEFISIDDQPTIDRLMTDFRGQPTLDYVALKQGASIDTFGSLAQRSRQRLAWPWRVLQGWT
jgi:FkbM family methyltransferase